MSWHRDGDRKFALNMAELAVIRIDGVDRTLSPARIPTKAAELKA